MGKSGNKIAPLAMHQMAMQAVGLPISIEFSTQKIVGYVTAATETEAGVSIEGLCSRKATDQHLIFVVPGMRINKKHNEGKTIVIDDITMFGFAITTDPDDDSLTPIKEEATEQDKDWDATLELITAQSTWLNPRRFTE